MNKIGRSVRLLDRIQDRILSSKFYYIGQRIKNYVNVIFEEETFRMNWLKSKMY